jgi:hypothetical protein
MRRNQSVVEPRSLVAISVPRQNYESDLTLPSAFVRRNSETDASRERLSFLDTPS